MRAFTEYCVEKSIRDWEDTNNPEVRNRYAALEGWASIVVNLVLAVLKGFFGVISGSVALIADAFHTLSDVSTSVVVIVSFRMARKPSDVSHPFGHGRMEAVGTEVVAVLLMVIGVEVFRGAVGRIIRPEAFEASWLVMGIIVATVIIKELLARFSRELGRMIASDTLDADFWHHRTDAISSVLVLVAFAGERIGLSFLDGIVGIVVAGMIVYTGWRIVRKGIDDLLGKTPSQSLVQEVKQVARAFPEILDVHELIIHQYGQTNVMSFHIQVSDELSLKAVHDLSEKVEAVVNKRFKTHATIHCDPVNIRDPETKAVRRSVEKFLQARAGASYHDLRMTGSPGRKTVFFDLMVDPEMGDEEAQALVRELKSDLMKAHASVERVVVEVEPKYAV